MVSMPELSLELAVRLASCFFLGSIPFAVLAMKGTGVDIRKFGSGNPGFNNVLRFSKPRAVVTLVGDLGKGLLAIWLWQKPGDTIAVGWLYGLTSILGHCYSPFLKFNGGKGIATSAGVMVYLYPKLAPVSMLAYAALRLVGAKRKWLEAGTISSLSAYALFVALLLVYEGPQPAFWGFLLLLFVAWRHKKNFQVLAGQSQPSRG